MSQTQYPIRKEERQQYRVSVPAGPGIDWVSLAVCGPKSTQTGETFWFWFRFGLVFRGKTFARTRLCDHRDLSRVLEESVVSTARISSSQGVT